MEEKPVVVVTVETLQAFVDFVQEIPLNHSFSMTRATLLNRVQSEADAHTPQLRTLRTQVESFTKVLGQAGITREISEIVGGAEALKG